MLTKGGQQAVMDRQIESSRSFEEIRKVFSLKFRWEEADSWLRHTSRGLSMHSISSGPVTRGPENVKNVRGNKPEDRSKSPRKRSRHVADAMLLLSLGSLRRRL